MEKVRIITTSWDDGHIDDKRLCNLLQKYDIPATLYISPKNREWKKNDLLSDSEVQVLSNKFEIGAHTMTHPELTEISLEEAEQEIAESKNHLEQLLGTEVQMFCYPRGKYNHSIEQIVQKVGFIGGRTIEPFRSEVPVNKFAIGTTNHTVNRPIPYSLWLGLRFNHRFLPHLFTKDWVQISCRMLDVIEKHGGIWHFWGHSWQITKHNWWNELEEVLEYAAQKNTFKKMTNGEIVQYLNTHE